jgi:hypothetical protein
MSNIKQMLRQIRERTTPEQSRFVKDEMDRIDRLYQWLDEKKQAYEDSAKSFTESRSQTSQKKQSPPTH